MKKAYKSPTVKFVKLRAQSLLSGSNGDSLGMNGSYGSGQLGKEEAEDEDFDW